MDLRDILALILLVGRCPANCKIEGLIPSQGTCLPGLPVWSPVSWGTYRKQSTDVSLPVFLPPFPSLLKKKKDILRAEQKD